MHKYTRFSLLNIIIYLYVATLSFSVIFRLPLINHIVISNIKQYILFIWLSGIIVLCLSNKMIDLKKNSFYYSKEVLYSLIFMLLYLILAWFNSPHERMWSLKGNHYNVFFYSIILAFMAVITLSLIHI